MDDISLACGSTLLTWRNCPVLLDAHLPSSIPNHHVVNKWSVCSFLYVSYTIGTIMNSPDNAQQSLSSRLSPSCRMFFERASCPKTLGTRVWGWRGSRIRGMEEGDRWGFEVGSRIDMSFNMRAERATSLVRSLMNRNGSRSPSGLTHSESPMLSPGRGRAQTRSWSVQSRLVLSHILDAAESRCLLDASFLLSLARTCPHCETRHV